MDLGLGARPNHPMCRAFPSIFCLFRQGFGVIEFSKNCIAFSAFVIQLVASSPTLPLLSKFAHRSFRTSLSTATLLSRVTHAPINNPTKSTYPTLIAIHLPENLRRFISRGSSPKNKQQQHANSALSSTETMMRNDDDPSFDDCLRRFHERSFQCIRNAYEYVATTCTYEK